VWESSVPAALCGQASSVAQTVSMVQSGAKVVASTCVLAVAEPPGFEKIWTVPWTELRAWPR